MAKDDVKEDRKGKVIFIIGVFVQILYGTFPAIVGGHGVAILYMVTTFFTLMYYLSHDHPTKGTYVHTSIHVIAFIVAVTALLGVPLYWLAIILLFDVCWTIGLALFNK